MTDKVEQTASRLQPIDKMDILDQMTESFDDDELQDICFELRIDYEGLSGTKKRGKIRALILYLIKLGQLQRLVEVCQKRRPGLQWTRPVPTPVEIVAPTKRSYDTRVLVYTVMLVCIVALIFLAGWVLSSREIGSRSLSVSTSLPNMIRPTVVYVQPTEVTAGWGRVASKDDTGAQKTLRDYYQVDLSEGRYEEAWSKLTNEYRNYAFLGGFASFKSQQQRGYTPLTELSGSGETCYQVHEANKLANPAYASRFNPNWSNYVDQAVFYGIFSDGGRFYFCLVKDTFSQWRIHTVSRAP